MRRALLAMVALVVASFAIGCAADLVPGRYACVDDACPSGWTCRGDDRCYPADYVLVADYVACRTDLECSSGRCQKYVLAAAQSHGTCAPSATCTQDADCGAAHVCLPNGACGLACNNTAECESSVGPQYECLQVPGPTSKKACLRFDPNEALDSQQTCPAMSTNSCQMPVPCFSNVSWDAQTGLCAWPCSPGAGCPGAAECVDVQLVSGQPLMPMCLMPCTSDADCGTGAATPRCLPRMASGAGTYCVPIGFGGKY